MIKLLMDKNNYSLMVMKKNIFWFCFLYLLITCVYFFLLFRKITFCYFSFEKLTKFLDLSFPKN